MSDIPVIYQHIPFADILRISREFDVCPYLITAIGWHETHWGKAGLGRVGFYTGYGAFDHGPDFDYANLETQIRGTARMMREWGMRPGKVTLERLIEGNRGDFGRIYATDRRWPVGVWTHYQKFNQMLDFNRKKPDDFETHPIVQNKWEERTVIDHVKGKENNQRTIDFQPDFEGWKEEQEKGYLQRNIELGPTQQVVRILVIIILIIFMMAVIGWAFKDEALKIVKTVRGG